MERHQMNPGMIEMSRAHADLRRREMIDSIGEGQGQELEDCEERGWLARAIATVMGSLGRLMVGFGQRLAQSARSLEYSTGDGGC